MAAKTNNEYRVIYQITEDDSPITMRVGCDGDMSLHRIMCGIAGWKVPISEWHEVIVHQMLDGTSLCEFTGAHLGGQYDHHYTFNGTYPIGNAPATPATTTNSVPWSTSVMAPAALDYDPVEDSWEVVTLAKKVVKKVTHTVLSYQNHVSKDYGYVH